MEDTSRPSTDTETRSPGAASREARRIMVHMPVDVRSASLAVIAAILSLYALQWAKEIVIPILMGIMVSYALTPIVDRMERWHVPRAAGATALLTAILCGVAWGGLALNDQVDVLFESLPAVTQKVREASQQLLGKTSAIERVQQAATEIAAATEPGAPAASTAASTPTTSPAAAVRRSRAAELSPAPAGTTRVDIRGYVLTGTLGVLAFIGQVAVVFFLALFLMSSGNTFRRKMVKLAGPRLSQKKVTVVTLDEITEQIQRYLLVQIAVSLVVGVATGAAFFALGLHQAAVWGVVAAVTNLIPYVGALLVGTGSAAVGLIQFGTLGMAMLIGASALAIHTVVGNVITPLWMGKASKMSPVAVFLSVLIFGWLWGVSGLLLGVPILLVVKSVCDRVEDLKPVGELLGA